MIGHGRRVSRLESTMLVAAAMGAGVIFTAPRMLLATAGRAGGVALVLLGLAGVFWAYTVSEVARRLPQRSLVLALERGAPWIVRPWLVFAAGFEVFFCAMNVREFAAVTTAIFIPGSPLPAVVGLILASAWTAARHRLEQLSRVVLVFFGAFALLGAVSFSALLLRATDQWSVLPGGPVELAPMLHADMMVLYMVAGLSAVPFLPPYEVPGRGLPNAAVGALLAAGLALLAYAATVSTGGPSFALAEIWPVVSALRTLVLRNFFINRFGLVVLFVGTGIVLSFAAIRLWTFAEALHLASGRRGSPALLAGIGAAIAFAIAIQPGSVATTEAVVQGVLDPWGLAVLAGWLPLTGLALWLDGGDGRVRVP